MEINYRDRAKAVTAEDLIRKYNLDNLFSDRKAINTLNDNLTKVNNNIRDYVESISKNIDNLQNQVDGNITAWFFSGVPNLNNQPAADWSNNNEMDVHLGDLYYDQNTGYSYRFAKINENYEWLKLSDSDITEALALANAAKDSADSKRRTFFNNPSTPYDAGDLWIYNGEIYRCIRSRSEGELNSADWVNDLIYTDDSVANDVKAELNSFKEDVQRDYVTNSIFETSTNSILAQVQSVQVKTDSKNTIFTTIPVPPYKVGDLYIQDEKIYVCVIPKNTGDFDIDDWILNLNPQEFATKAQIELIDNSIELLTVQGKNNSEKISGLELSTDNINASVSEIQNELLLYGEKNGNPAIITNAGNYPLVTQKLVGGSNQQTRSGKNSIILADANFSSSGVNVSVKDGVITIDGTPSESTTIEIALKNSINVYWASYYVLSLNNAITHNGTFTIVGDNSLRSTIASFATESATAIKSRNPNSTYTTTYNKIVLNLTANEEYNNFIIKPQFEYTGTTASSAVPTEWEQGGISPSLDYPSEVVNAGIRKNLFKIPGKNLKPVEVGDDLSGKTLILSFPDEITDFISTGQSSEFIKVSDTKYLNYFKSSTSGIVEEVSFHNDGEEIFLWSEYDYTVMDNSKEFVLPDDFGIVTSIDAECGAYGYVNIEVPESGITYTPNDDGTFNLNGTATADAEFMTSLSLDDSLLKSGLQYEAVTNVDEENIEIAVLGYNDDTQVDEYFLLSSTNKKISKTINISETVNKIVYKIRVLNNAEIDLKNIEVGLYENTSPNLFVPYGKNFIELITKNSSDDNYEINSCNMILDNVEDGLPALSEEIADYIENNKIYKSVGVLKLKGWSSDENWSVAESNGISLFSMNLNCIGNIGLSTHLKYDTTGTSTANNQFRLENNSLVVIAPRLGGTNFTDVVSWKNYLQEQFNNNKTVTIYYPLPETQELALNYSGNLEPFKDYNRVECMDSMITDMYVKYLTNSAITDTYALKSELDMTAGAIRAEVNDEVSGLNASLELKVNREDVVSELNASADVIDLRSGKFTLESEGLSIDNENGVEVGGFSMSHDSFHGTSSIVRNYTQNDITRLQGIIQGTIYPTDDDYSKYDLNGDHYFDSQDLLRVQRIVLGSASPTQSVEYNINSNDPVRCVSIKNTESGDENVNFGLFGGYIRELGFYQLTSKDGENETTILASGIQTPVVNQTSLESKKKNFEPLENALDLIEKTDVYKYHLKGESDDHRKHIGLVIPDKGDFKIANEFISTTGDSVDTYSIIATCLKAIKELNDEIKILKKELERSGRDK